MNALEPLKAWWKDASPLARALVVTGALAVLLTTGYFGSRDPTHHWVPINESPMGFAEAGRLTEALSAMNVPYRTEPESGGQSVLVPIERADELRMTLASSGHTTSDTSDPYDKLWKNGAPTFQTSSMERAMRVHAKTKSIERKLATLRPVKRAMVDLALPENSILRRSDHLATASVVIELEPRYGFSKELAASIRDTVAHAVEGLTPNRVAVTDHLGRRIGPAAGDAATALASRTLALRQEREANYEARIVELLEPVVGRGKIVARVSATMDMSRVQQRSEEFDPENAVVRRERKSSDNASSEERHKAVAAGVGGNAPQRPGGGDDGVRTRTNNDNSITETDYAVPTKIVETSKPMGEMRRLSVAVVIDSKNPEPTEGEDGESKDDKTLKVPVTAEIKAKVPVMPSERALAELVKKAVGFDAKRGDQIEILYAPFSRPEFPEASIVVDKPLTADVPPWVPFAIVLFLGFVLVGGGLTITERRRRKAMTLAEEAEADEKTKAADEEIESIELPTMPLKQQVRGLATENVQATGHVLKGWLAREAPET